MGNSGDKNSKEREAAQERQLDQRKSDATSNKTLNDLEETETDSSSTDIDLDPGPSPDGLLDEPDEGGRMKDEG